MFIIKRMDIIKMSFLHKAVYRLNASPSKNSMTLSTEVEQKNPKVCRDSQKTLNS